ncbi:DUF6377 domain-containing protein [Solitalea longa]|uniref:DUF6377 domain-containing protein n=1 Tax=Solitalea longa TaxID=2079460 RepID=UPI001FAF99EE|nr:DUF6377 domain-containing protein [Solitalea longa]
MKSLNSVGSTLMQLYLNNNNLINEYQKFKLDSAITYVKWNLVIASQLNKIELIDESKLQLAALYSSSGRYRESESMLKSIEKKRLSKPMLADYYEANFRFYEHYATNSFDVTYIKEIAKYRDSLLSVLDTSSLRYKINLAQQNVNSSQLKTAERELVPLLKIAKPNTPDFAMVTYLLGVIYSRSDMPDLEKKYFMLSAMADLESAVKDHASTQRLALIYFKEGNIDEAYKLMKSAIEDAIFCNVQFRTTQLSSFYTIINTAYQEKEAKRKSQLQLYLVTISLLAIFLVMAVFYVYKQMRKVSKIKEELFGTNEKLAVLNKQITKTNEQLNSSNTDLSESNRVKEEYIAHFFDLCSTYINKLESYRKELNKKVSEKRFDELSKLLKSTSIVDNEVEELYRNFDHIFLNLYPTFVKDFNALLIPDEQIEIKPGDLLNTELRIFALIRLGITDSVKIAAFLRYSLSTIYNYRTKARNKAAVSRDDFEKLVIRIGSETTAVIR